jgi:hypothetical protein
LIIILRDYNSHTKEITSKITFVIFSTIKLSKSKLKHEEVVRIGMKYRLMF